MTEAVSEGIPVTDSQPPQLIARFNSRVEADLARALLHEYGIESRLSVDDVQGLHPELGMLTGGAGLLVVSAQADEAKAILEDTPVPAEAGDDNDERDETPPKRRIVRLVVAVILVVLLLAAAIDAFAGGGLTFL